MTISATISRWAYNGDGSTKIFPYTNKITATSDLIVTVGGTLQVLDTDYTVSGVLVVTGGNVTFTVAPPTGTDNVIIVRNTPDTQGSVIPEGGAFPAKTVEDGLDKATILAQQNADLIARAITQPDADVTAIGDLPTKALRANKHLAFDGDGDPTLGVDITSLTATQFSDPFTGDGSTVNFTLSATPASAAAVDVYLDGVHQKPTTDYTVSGTTLTFITAPLNGVAILANGSETFAGIPTDGSVTTAKIATDAVTLVKISQQGQGADVASAATLTLGTDGNQFDITGAVTITAIATIGVGTVVFLHFDAAPILTHNATTLVLPTGANITPAAGDEAIFHEYAAGNWRCVNYERANGKSLTAFAAAGTILQVQSATKTDTFTTTSTTYVDITGISVAITPRDTNSTIKLTFMGLVGGTSVANRGHHLQFLRDSTAIGIGDAASNRVRSTQSAFATDSSTTTSSIHMAWVDAPATASAITYKVQLRIGTTGTAVVGRSGADVDNADSPRSASILIAEEIAG